MKKINIVKDGRQTKCGLVDSWEEEKEDEKMRMQEFPGNGNGEIEWEDSMWESKDSPADTCRLPDGQHCKSATTSLNRAFYWE